MASTEGPARAHGQFRVACLSYHANDNSDRHARRRPFANWMKRLANLKNLHNENATARQNTKKLGAVNKNHPYSMQARTTQQDYSNSQISPSLLSTPHSRHSSTSREKVSFTLSDGQGPPKSRAPTMGTTAETTISDTGKSGAGTTGTTATAARTEGDRDSTFSSPSPSLRSMTTTLTTMQSTTPVLGQPAGGNHPNNAVYSTAQPASAVPAHLVPHSHPATYHIATANNVLTDDASIITLASSSKRRRRNSLDTNASIRALAPASMFGGSRESLPLSILSSSAHYASRDPTSARDREGDGASFRDTASSHYPRSISAMNVERASLISASGVTAPALTSERNSYISNKPTGDGASVRSGMLGHGLDKERDRSLYHARNDSIGGLSITRERFKDTPSAATRDGSISAGTGMPQDSYFKEREMVTAPTSPMPAP